ncbi:uncharacterized protein THITE_2049812, partial [Thermothielavioides terrestris NRRL 8126]
FLVEAYNNLIGYIKAKILLNKSSKSVKSFILQYILFVVVNRGSKFKGEVKEILCKLDIKRVIISLYNLYTNSVNKASYIPIAILFTKITNSIGKRWRELLLYILYIDYTTIKGSYKISPFFLIYNYKPISLVEFNVPI